jgi:diadenylate cyclase
MINKALDLFFNNWRSGVEIGILSVAIYYAYLYFRGTRGAKVLTGFVVIFLTLTLVSTLLELQVISWIIRSLTAFLALALLVIFQPELRRALAALGSHHIFSTVTQRRETIEVITEAVFELSNREFGALLAIERDTNIQAYAENGVMINCELSTPMVLTIFQPKTPLHDGGLIIRNDEIIAAACIFPVSQRDDIDRNLGLRHRAGLGLSDESDAVIIVVSEETGIVSICHRGKIERNFEPESLKHRLAELMLVDSKYEEAAAEQPGGENSIPPARHDAVVPDPKERGNTHLAP